MIRGPRGTWLLHEWWARRQGHTSRNTAEAETSALDEGVFAEAAPLSGILEQVLGRDVRVVAEMDNSTCIQAISRGFSRRLAYLKKVRRISLGALHELSLIHI